MRQVKKSKKKVERAIMVEEQGTFRKERETRRKKPSRVARVDRPHERNGRPFLFGRAYHALKRRPIQGSKEDRWAPESKGRRGPRDTFDRREAAFQKQMVRSKFSYHSIDRARPRSNDDDNQNPVLIFGGVEVPH